MEAQGVTLLKMHAYILRSSVSDVLTYVCQREYIVICS